MQTRHVLQPTCSWPVPDAPCDPMRRVWHRRDDLSGVHFVTGFHAYPPNAYIRPDGVASGFFPELWHVLQGTLNFTYHVVQGGTYGVKMVRTVTLDMVSVID